MPSAVYATAEDFEMLTAQVLTEPQRIQVAALLEEASGLMRGSAVDLDERLASDTIEAVVVRGVCVRVVERYLANPTQASQIGVGPFTRAYAAANARGMFLTEDDLAKLAPPPPAAGRAPAVGTIRVGLPVGTARNGPCR